VDERFSDARIQLHWAAQAVAGVGRTLLVPRVDDSHTTFTWSPVLGALVQEPFNSITAGLRLRDLTLLANADELPLQGRTLDHAFAFMESQFATPLKRPDVDLPDHPVAHGAKFDADATHLAELARLYDEAAAILGGIGTPVRCWPHHFDIATLLTYSDHTIGIGFSPGDAGSPEPYYYVTRWPYPDPARLGALKNGRWNTTGWTGAVFPASRFADVHAFIAEARAAL
jgi:hypothetical protein